MTLMGEKINAGFWWGKLKECEYLEDPGIDRKIILKWVLGR